MAASLEEAYLFSSYTVNTPQTKAKDGFAVETTSLVEVYEEDISSKKQGKSSASRNRRSIAVTTVQRNAVHLVDASDQSPLASFTVSPSVRFTSKAVSISFPFVKVEEEGVASTSAAVGQAHRTRKTFAGVEVDGEYEVWCWTEQERGDGTAIGDAVKGVFAVDSAVLSIDVSAIEKHVLVAYAGKLDIHNLEFQYTSTLPLQPSLNGSETFHIFTTPLQPLSTTQYLNIDVPESADILPLVVYSSTPTSSGTPAKDGAKSKKSKKRESLVTSEPSLLTKPTYTSIELVFLAVNSSKSAFLKVASVSLPHEDTLDVSFDASWNIVTVLKSNGQIATFNLSSSKTLNIPADAFTDSETSLKVNVLHLNPLKQLTLSPMKVSASNAQCFALRSTKDNSSSSFVLVAAPKQSHPTSPILLLLIDAKYGLIIAEQEFAIPGSSVSTEGVPPESTAGQFQLVQLKGYGVAVSLSPSSGRATVYAVPCSVPQNSSLANLVGKQALTLKYTSTETDLPRVALSGLELAQPEKDLLEALSKLLTFKKETRDVPGANKVFEQWKAANGKTAVSPSTAAQLLKLATPQGQSDLAMSKTIVETLIDSSLVADGSLPENGLTSTLLEACDWRLVKLALQRLVDIPEKSLVKVLKAASSAFIDAPAQSFIEVLALIVDAPVTPALLRSVLRDQTSLEDLLPTLQILDEWLVPGTAQAPTIVKVVAFTQCIFDAHLVSILQQQTLRPLVLRMSQHVSRHIALSVSVQKLRGPIDALVKAYKELKVEEQERDRRLKMKKAKKDPLKDPKVMWERKKRLKEESMLIKDYALDEFRL